MLNVNGLNKNWIEKGEIKDPNNPSITLKRYYLLRKPRKKTFYIIWENKIGTVREVRIIQAKIRQLVSGWYNLYEVRFSNDNRIAIRRINRNREHNRAYKRKNPSFYICRGCGGLFDVDDMKERETAEWYCDSCYDEKFTQCQNCEETFDIDELKQDPDGNLLCESCFEDKWVICDSCNDVIDNGESYHGVGGDGNYCNECWGERYATCDNCGETVYSDDICYSEDDDQYYCNSCYNEIENGIIKSHEYRPEPIFEKEVYENTLYMGFELEIEVNGRKKDYAENLFDFLQKKNIHKRYYFKRDGSLNNGFEIVSHPATLKKYHTSHKLYDIVKYLRDTKEATSYDNKTCGLHIHINREYFTKKEIGKVMLFFNNSYRQLKNFSQRTDRQIEGFCKYEDFDIKDYENYVDNQKRLNTHDRYMAVNLCNDDTIEFRIFRGTLDYKRFLACLMFVDAVCNFVKETSYKSMNWEKFKEWLVFVNRYNHLEKYLKSKEI